MADDAVALNKKQLSEVFKALRNMDKQATEEAQRQSGALAEYARKEVISASSGLQSRAVATRITQGSKVKKSSRIGEITFGFAAQKFSGGATTKVLWGPSEFGTNKLKQFPVWSGPNPSGGAGSKGYFIYPTLRRIQPYIVAEWTKSFDKILKEWT
jgi:hypothetical protein